MKSFKYSIALLIAVILTELINVQVKLHAQAAAKQNVLDVSNYRKGTLIPHRNRMIPFTQAWTAQENGQAVYYGYQPPQYYIRAEKIITKSPFFFHTPSAEYKAEFFDTGLKIRTPLNADDSSMMYSRLTDERMPKLSSGLTITPPIE